MNKFYESRAWRELRYKAKVHIRNNQDTVCKMANGFFVFSEFAIKENLEEGDKVCRVCLAAFERGSNASIRRH